MFDRSKGIILKITNIFSENVKDNFGKNIEKDILNEVFYYTNLLQETYKETDFKEKRINSELDKLRSIV